MTTEENHQAPKVFIAELIRDYSKLNTCLGDFKAHLSALIASEWGTAKTLQTVDEEKEAGERIEPIAIGEDGRCTCTCAGNCPLGRSGMSYRCTEEELKDAGISTFHEREEASGYILESKREIHQKEELDMSLAEIKRELAMEKLLRSSVHSTH